MKKFNYIFVKLLNFLIVCGVFGLFFKVQGQLKEIYIPIIASAIMIWAVNKIYTDKY